MSGERKGLRWSTDGIFVQMVRRSHLDGRQREFPQRGVCLDEAAASKLHRIDCYKRVCNNKPT